MGDDVTLTAHDLKIQARRDSAGVMPPTVRNSVRMAGSSHTSARVVAGDGDGKDGEPK